MGSYCVDTSFDVFKSKFIAKIVKNNAISTNRSGLCVRVRRNLIRNTGRHFLAYKISPSHHAHCFPGSIDFYDLSKQSLIILFVGPVLIDAGKYS